MVDKVEIARRFGQSAMSYDSSSVAQRKAVAMLVAALEPFVHSGSSVFEVGCGTGSLTASIIRSFKPHIYIANDISAGMLGQLRVSTSDNILSTLQGDAESIDWPKDMDIVASASAVQWFEYPLSFVGKALSSVGENGVVGLATYGPQTFCELQQLGVRGLHYPSVEEWHEEIERLGMSLLSSHVDSIKLHYPSSLMLMRDLQQAGVTATDRKMSAPQMRKFLCDYDARFMVDGEVPLTYEIYIFVFARR